MTMCRILASAGLLANLLGAAAGHPGHVEHAPPEVPVVVVEFADFASPECGRVAELLKGYAKGRELSMQVVFKHAAAGPNALLAHEAALAAGAQGKFWEMHDALFAARASEGGGDVMVIAAGLGLEMGAFGAAMRDREFRARVMRDVAEARGLGVRVLPTLFVDGVKLEGIGQVEAFLTRPSEAETPGGGDVVPDAVAEVIDDREFEFDLEGSPSTGPEDAAVTIVEFSDLKCGFCGVNSRVLDELVALYPGKVRRVFRHFPIHVGAEGRLPHELSMAAVEQGKFWEVHHALMEGVAGSREEMIERVKAAGVDYEAAMGVVTSRKYGALIDRDIAEGDRLGIRATPTTFINGRRFVGKQTLDGFRQVVEEVLAGTDVFDVVLAGEEAEERYEVGPDPEDALARLELFVDFGDPRSVELAGVVGELRREREFVSVRFRHAPASAEGPVMRAHVAAMAAGEQGKFWPMVSALMRSPGAFSEAELEATARGMGLDLRRFREAMARGEGSEVILRERDGRGKLAAQAGVGGSGPMIALGDAVYGGGPDAGELARFVDANACCGKPVPKFGLNW